MFARLGFKTLALGCAFACSTFVGSVAWGQADPEGFITQAELRRSRTYAPALAEMVVDRMGGSAKPYPGLVGSPAPSVGEKASLLAGALAEDAGFRIGQTVQAVLSGFNPSIIIDGDWTKVTNAKATPYKGTCHIESTWGDGSQSSGTAFFVGRRVLLTNAHNCWSGSKTGNWASSIEVNPARKGDTRPYGSANCTNFWVPTEWVSGSEGNRDFDIAWLILDDRTLYNRVGYYIGYKTSTTTALTGYNLNVNGYPNPYAWNFQMYKDYETKNNVVSTSQFQHYCDTLGGSSGSCCYVILDGSRYCVGVHCAGSTGSTKFNVATRMTKRYFDSTKDFKADYP